MARRFDQFVAIDWSGAKGERHTAIVMAVADADGGPPILVRREKGWTRGEIVEILTEALPNNTLVGMDLGISLPYADEGAFFPGWDESPPDAKTLWALVESICSADEHYAVSNFVDHPVAAQYFRRHGGREGDRFGGGQGRFRLTEREQAKLGCKPYSNFNLVGAAQVGKSSLSGMRILHALRGTVPVWPIDPLPITGSVIVEIYTALAAMAAGRTASRSKIRTHGELDDALVTLGSPPLGGSGTIDDHTSDSLVTAAWLRGASQVLDLWSPQAMTSAIARTEGWTFGVP